MLSELVYIMQFCSFRGDDFESIFICLALLSELVLSIKYQEQTSFFTKKSLKRSENYHCVKLARIRETAGQRKPAFWHILRIA